MANKSSSRNWNDIQVAIASVSMALTLGLWNLFAGPDRETAERRAQEEAAERARQEAIRASMPTPAPQVTAVPTPMQGKLLLGGQAPQTQIIIQSGSRGGGGGGGDDGGGGGGGGAVASTGSS